MQRRALLRDEAECCRALTLRADAASCCSVPRVSARLGSPLRACCLRTPRAGSRTWCDRTRPTRRARVAHARLPRQTRLRAELTRRTGTSTCRTKARPCRVTRRRSKVVTRATLSGSYVVLAAEPFCVCGVDVAAPGQLRRPGASAPASMQQYVELFKRQFTSSETRRILAAGDEGTCCLPTLQFRVTLTSSISGTARLLSEDMEPQGGVCEGARRRSRTGAGSG